MTNTKTFPQQHQIPETAGQPVIMVPQGTNPGAAGVAFKMAGLGSVLVVSNVLSDQINKVLSEDEVTQKPIEPETMASPVEDEPETYIIAGELFIGNF